MTELLLLVPAVPFTVLLGVLSNKVTTKVISFRNRNKPAPISSSSHQAMAELRTVIEAIQDYSLKRSTISYTDLQSFNKAFFLACSVYKDSLIPKYVLKAIQLHEKTFTTIRTEFLTDLFNIYESLLNQQTWLSKKDPTARKAGLQDLSHKVDNWTHVTVPQMITTYHAKDREKRIQQEETRLKSLQFFRQPLLKSNETHFYGKKRANVELMSYKRKFESLNKKNNKFVNEYNNYYEKWN